MATDLKANTPTCLLGERISTNKDDTKSLENDTFSDLI